MNLLCTYYNYNYRSESPSQVFYILIQWLLLYVESNGIEAAENVTLAYDNICNIERMKISQQPLPFAPQWTSSG